MTYLSLNLFIQTLRDQNHTLKNPMTATSLSAIRDSASVTPARVETAGPVRFFSQLTMSSACLPAARQQNTITQVLLYAQTSWVKSHRSDGLTIMI